MFGIISIPRLINLLLALTTIKIAYELLKDIVWIIDNQKRRVRIAAYIGIIVIMLVLYMNIGQIYLHINSIYEKIKWDQFWPFPYVQHIVKPSNGLIAKSIYERINRIRRMYGLNPLEWDNKLAEIAYYHSQNMAEHHFFDHIDQNGDGPTERAAYFGYFCRKTITSNMYVEGIGEDIFMIENYYGREEEIAKEIVDGWMNSSGHRSNILNANYNREGIGVVVLNNYIYITQDFC